MPNINIDDAYILDETGAQVDQVTGLYFKNENASDTEKAQARANIGAGGTNPNLLDNWYFVGGGSQLGDGIFPINQRGQTNYTAQKSFDRWVVDGNVTVTLQSGNIRVQAMAAYVGLYQAIPMSRLKNGETYTFSIIIDGNMVTQTFVLNADGNWNNIYYGDDWYTTYKCANGICQVKVINSSGSFDHTIKAVKLEKGTASTLANDAPPDFGEELRKCQRYLFVLDIPANLRLSSVAIASDTTNGAFSVVTPVNMAKSAIAASISGSLIIDRVGAVSSIPWATAFGNNVYVAFVVNGAMVAGTMYPVVASAQVTKLILSAEL